MSISRRRQQAAYRYDDLDDLMARMDSSLDDQIAPPLKSPPTSPLDESFASSSTSSSRQSSSSNRPNRVTEGADDDQTPQISSKEWSAKLNELRDVPISSRSLPSSPREQTIATTSSRSPYGSSHQASLARSTSSTKLHPRAPRSERIAQGEFDILRELSSSSPRLAKSSSTRSARLRQDLEQVANQIRRQASENSLPGTPAVKVVEDTSPSHPGSTLDLDETGPAAPPNAGLAISLDTGSPTALGSPMPSPGMPNASKHLVPPLPNDKDDVRSLSSNSLHSIGSAGVTWAAASVALRLNDSPGRFSQTAGPFTPRSAQAVDPDDSPRMSIREMKEWSQACWMWQRDKPASTSASMSMNRMAPLLIREVPGVVKRKMGKRESSHNLAMLESQPAGPESGDNKPRLNGLFSSTKPKLTVIRGPSATNREGYWRPMTSVLREDGHLRLFNEDKVLTVSVHLPSCLRTDLRQADFSLFGQPHVIAIHRRSSNAPLTPSMSSTTAVDEATYLRMSSTVAAETWLVMALCFARPEFFITSASGIPRFDAPDVGTLDDATSGDDLCRIFRRIQLSIIDGRGIGEAHSESPVRERKFDDTASTTTSNTDSQSITSTGERSSRRQQDPWSLEQTSKSGHGVDSFFEILLDNVVLARTGIRKGTANPVWNESFDFTDLPPLTQPLTLNLYSVKSTKMTLLGSLTVRIPDLARGVLREDWHAICGVGLRSTFVGEVNLSVLVEEEAVIPSVTYSPMLTLLLNDTDADLAVDMATEFSTQLEEVVNLLLRIYFASSVLLDRLFRLADIEIGESADNSAILFRGNSVLTKSVELYLRLVGAEYLEASLGDVVRRLCAEKVDIEIDPSKLKANVKDKVVEKSVNELQSWTFDVWRSIYDARHKCPNDVRLIFQRIQQIVCARYGDDQKKVRSTSVSAFAFLRFFVPAILNPKLFGLVPVQPDAKSQRALTLIAKSLQGLANFATFGQKEPWMYHMNDFVQDNTSAFIDFIDYVSTPSASAKNEWTDSRSAVYLAAQRLTDSLPQAAREGVPHLPLMIDLPRNLGQLAARVAQREIAPTPQMPDAEENSSVASSRRTLSSKYAEFREACVAVHEESKRRGGGLLSVSAPAQQAPLVKSSFLSRARGPTISNPVIPRTRSSLVDYTGMLPSTGSLEEIHIHARQMRDSVATTASEASEASSVVSSEAVVGAAANKARSHIKNRTFVVNGLSPSRDGKVRPNFVGVPSPTIGEDFERSLSVATSEPFALKTPPMPAMPVTPEMDSAADDKLGSYPFPSRSRSVTPDLRKMPSFASATPVQHRDSSHSGQMSTGDVSDTTTATSSSSNVASATTAPSTSNNRPSTFFGIPRSVSMMPSRSTGSASIASSTSSLSIVVDALTSTLDGSNRRRRAQASDDSASERRSANARSGASFPDLDEDSTFGTGSQQQQQPELSTRRRSLWRMTGSSSKSNNSAR